MVFRNLSPARDFPPTSRHPLYPVVDRFLFILFFEEVFRQKVTPFDVFMLYRVFLNLLFRKVFDDPCFSIVMFSVDSFRIDIT